MTGSAIVACRGLLGVVTGGFSRFITPSYLQRHLELVRELVVQHRQVGPQHRQPLAVLQRLDPLGDLLPAPGGSACRYW